MPKVDSPPKDHLNDLRIAGFTRDEMAALYDVSLPRMKRWITKLGVAPRPMKEKKESDREKPRYMPVDDGISLMDECRQVLDSRMGEDHRGYLLDGRPVSSHQIVSAAGLTFGRRRKTNEPASV